MKLHDYFGRYIPSLQVRAPHVPSYLNGGSSEDGGVSMSSGVSILVSDVLHVRLMTERRSSIDTPPFRRRWALNPCRLDQDPGRDVAAEEAVPK